MPIDLQVAQIDQLVGADNSVNGIDPAFQSPTDPLTETGIKSKAGSVVFRDLPIVTIQNAWSVAGARNALASHCTGIFEQSAQLWDSIIADDRVTATLGSRTTGLFGREVRFKAADDSDAAKECLRAWEAWWPKLAGDSAMKVINETAIGMGFAHAQVAWDTTKPVWGPYLRPWNARYTYYNWDVRKFVANTQDGQRAIMPGNGKWFTHAPWGEYRGWMRGALRSVTEPWMLRHFAFRDMARFSEIHGLPTRVGKVPAVSDPNERAYFETQIANMGSDTAMILPQSVDGVGGAGYDYSLVEAKDTSWEVFPGLIDRCDMSIVLAIMFQNLTTEVTGGAFAATKSHMDVRQGGIQGDDEAWKFSIYNQLARPFAYFNFGDPELAPWTSRDVQPRADLAGNADQFAKFATALEVMARGGLKFKSSDELRAFASKSFGLEGLPDFEINDPSAGSPGAAGVAP